MKLRAAAWVLVGFVAGVGSSVLTAKADPPGPYAPFDQMARVLSIIEAGYVDDMPADRVLDGAIKGMVGELDPHSAYMTREEYLDFQSDTKGKFGGVGVEVDQRDDVITVIAPIEGSPAERAGVKSGDRIVSVDGKMVRGTRLDKLVDMMRGAPGTKVKLGVVREGTPDVIDFELTREVIVVKSVEAKRVGGNVVYIRLKQFQEQTHRELIEAVARIRKESDAPIAGVLLDLRYNPGGLVDQAEGVADELLDGGGIYSTRHRGKIVDDVRATPGGALSDVPVVALVNEYSASAAELLSGALQDNDRALIVGARTFGKGSVQTILDLPGGAGMRLTTMRYYTPNGGAIQAEGIMPDVVVTFTAGTGDVVREADLEGHLEQEKAARPGAKIEQVTAPKGTKPAERIGDVPADPTQSQDFLVAEGYRRLRARMTKVAR